MATVSERYPTVNPHFSLTRTTGSLVFVAGQMAFDSDMAIVGQDVSTQTRVVLSNVRRALESIGLGLADVVKTTAWLVRSEDFQSFNDEYGRVFEGMDLPARSTVRADLMMPGALIEIEAIAQIPEAKA